MSPSTSPLKEMLDGIPMSLVKFFSPDLGQSNHTRVVHRTDEPIDISSSAASMHLVGKVHPSRATAPLDGIYPPDSDAGEEMSNYEDEEAGVLVDGRLELTVGSETYVFGHDDSYHFENDKSHRSRNPHDVPARLISVIIPANF